MQFILTIGLALTFAFSLLQCDNKMAAKRSETAQTNSMTANAQANLSTAATPEEAPRISLEDAKKDYDARTAIFIDTRPEGSYKTEHVKGAINIPSDQMAARYAEIPKNKKIIAYCS